MKSEPSIVGVDDVLAMPKRTIDWWGVRNYQARNFMRDQMQVGDGVFFYHSSCPEPGIAGLAEVAKRAYPDRTQFDLASPYYDPKSTPESPRWVNVDIRVVKKIRLIGLDELRKHP
jgi:predicted RNA-binding protein with PUA-like domain